MKISIKNIKGETFFLNVEKPEKIIEIKNKIKELKAVDVETQKIIFKGQVTQDEKTAGDYDFKEGDVLILMITKKAAVQNVEAQNKEKAEEKKVDVPAPVNKPVPMQNPNPIPANQNVNSLVMGEEYNKTVDEIVKMGFIKEDVMKALNAAYNNPDRAIDYLINGIPNIPVQNNQNQGYHAPPIQNPAGAGAGAGVGAGAGAGLGFGAGAGVGINPNDPLLAQLRNNIRNDPAVLQNLLSNLATTNPELFQVISNNPEEFMRILEEGGEGGEGGFEDENMEEEDEEGMQIELTEEDTKAIDRLCSLGFDKNAVTEAYLICEKNEELTANYLFDNHGN